MENQTIKASLQSIEIPAINLYVQVISILIIVFLIKLFFGKEIVILLNQGWEKVKDRLNKMSHENWIAHCRERKEWPQKQDVLPLDLKGHYIKSLTFSITLKGNPEFWRAGFIVGNEKLRANEIVNTNNGITIHTGGEYQKRDKILPIWKYYDNFGPNNPDFISVKSDNPGLRTFDISINKNNFMQVKAQNEVIFAQKIEPSFRRRVYLKAWVDKYPDAKIKFRDISYLVCS
jgi:hypothetical protein